MTLLNLSITRSTTQCCQSVGRSIERVLIGQAGKKSPFSLSIYICIYIYIYIYIERERERAFWIYIYSELMTSSRSNIVLATRIIYNVNGSCYLTSRHRRVWKATPPPQEREHSLGSDQGPQLPDSCDAAAPPSTTKLPGRYVCDAAWACWRLCRLLWCRSGCCWNKHMATL
jgi:hypothetical protein